METGEERNPKGVGRQCTETGYVTRLWEGRILPARTTRPCGTLVGSVPRRTAYVFANLTNSVGVDMDNKAQAERGKRQSVGGGRGRPGILMVKGVTGGKKVLGADGHEEGIYPKSSMEKKRPIN